MTLARCTSISDAQLDRVEELVSSSKPVASAIATIRAAIDRYGWSHISLAFNGGKDCMVLLHLFYFVLTRQYKITQNPIPCLHIAEDRHDTFPEIEQFIEKCVHIYGLHVLEYDGDIRTALTQVKTDHPEIQGILMGTRRTDPHGSCLSDFSYTDTANGWPGFMRVNPILDWSYADVWEVIDALGIPVCTLYEQGYTSLGAISTTLPNPMLSTGVEGEYRHARELSDPTGQNERLGRKRKPKGGH